MDGVGFEGDNGGGHYGGSVWGRACWEVGRCMFGGWGVLYKAGDEGVWTVPVLSV